MKKILIIGATSAIATACSRLWVQDEAEFFLVGRDAKKLQQTADDLTARGAKATHQYLIDLNKLEEHSDCINNCFESMESIDLVLIAHGTLPQQEDCEKDITTSLQEFSNNGLSVISLLTLLANKMQTQRSGTIAVISSVAGDRGRPSNYLYGSAKATVSVFCEGLRVRLFKAGVHVLTIKPGFVDTPMTQGLKLPKLLLASTEKVAHDIDKAVKKKKNTVYVPWFWRPIMLVIKIIPEFIFKRMSL